MGCHAHAPTIFPRLPNPLELRNLSRSLTGRSIVTCAADCRPLPQGSSYWLRVNRQTEAHSRSRAPYLHCLSRTSSSSVIPRLRLIGQITGLSSGCVNSDSTRKRSLQCRHALSQPARTRKPSRLTTNGTKHNGQSRPTFGESRKRASKKEARVSTKCCSRIKVTCQATRRTGYSLVHANMLGMCCS